jgi:IclR family transcriptional regulator, acetate operon repressor
MNVDSRPLRNGRLSSNSGLSPKLEATKQAKQEKLTRSTNEEAPDDADASIVGRSFALLRAFRSDAVLGVSDLARRTGLPRTTVHRLANQLYEEGALSRVGTKFRVGPALFELGNLHFPQRLRDTVQPILDDLQRATGSDVSLVELVGKDVIVVATARARRSTARFGHLGQRIPAHACAGGQSLLAQDGKVTPQMLRALTEKTLTDHRKLRRRLTEIQISGIAIEHGEAELDRTTIAVSVMNRHGRILAALMVNAITAGINVDAITNTVTTFSRVLTSAGQEAAIGFFATLQPNGPSPVDASLATDEPNL